MSLVIASLNSGSNGNCYYIGNQQEAILIDVGLSCREIEKRMVRLDLDPRKVKAVFVSHEHSDHIRGIPVFSKKYGLPVYLSLGTFQNSRMLLQNPVCFSGNERFQIGELEVQAFSKIHDAADPFSFNVSFQGTTVGIYTDIGKVCDQLTSHFKQCHAAFLESNYDDQMLEQGSYPYYLKNRIKGGRGHLSNDQALHLFRQHKSAGLQLVMLAHLSKDNNHPLLVEQLFRKFAGNTQIVVASRDRESEVYEISHLNAFCQEKQALDQRSCQLSLF